MGAEIREVSGRTDRTDNKNADNRTKGESGRTTDTTHTEAGRTGAIDTGRTGGENKTSEVSRMASLTEEEKKAERNARRRERYAQKKAEGGQTVKPRKVKAGKPNTFDTKQLDTMIMAMSSIVASRPNMSHWQLDEKEVQSITTPLAGILAESELMSKLNDNSNQIALAVACVSVFAPRVMVTVAQMSEKKKTKVNVREVKNNDKNRVSKTDDKVADSGNRGGTSDTTPVNGISVPTYYSSGY